MAAVCLAGQYHNLTLAICASVSCDTRGGDNTITIGFGVSEEEISNQPFPNMAEKIFRIRARLFENIWRIGVFEHDFLQKQVDGVLWFESLRNNFS